MRIVRLVVQAIIWGFLAGLTFIILLEYSALQK